MILYKQPLLCHISGAGSTFCGSGRRLATRCVFCRMTVRFIRPTYCIVRRPGKRRATGHVAR
ncbi:hypothetical protein KCP73_03200 [Salmonella enterica subsp. enterica]|nr:hypothetical protein KCP73_03200 [Salmonella enterica subsp. enterica]